MPCRFDRESEIFYTERNPACPTGWQLRKSPRSRTYTVNDIAAILGIGRASAYQLANSGWFQTGPGRYFMGPDIQKVSGAMEAGADRSHKQEAGALSIRSSLHFPEKSDTGLQAGGPYAP